MSIEFLLKNASLANYPSQSRVHRLASFDTPNCSCYVKRDDELGFGISGSKIRKYLSLLPYLLSQKIEEAVVIGSPFSNHVLSICQLLKENKIDPVLYLMGEKPVKKLGNFHLLSLLIEEEKMHFLPRNAWARSPEIAIEHVRMSEQEGKKSFYLPMGAACKEALTGMLTLPLDILRNEQENAITFDHVFVDAGTGMMAACLILAFSFLQRTTTVHVVQMAEDKSCFEDILQLWKKELQELLNAPILSPVHYHVYPPHSARSFGSVNKSIFKTIEEVARAEGFFLDPIYTAKLMQTGKKVLTEKPIMGKALFIHSGGGLSLLGFQH